jgi:twitching motility protein PilT
MLPIDRLLSIVVSQGGSDLHVAEGQVPKMRRHGELMRIGDKVVSQDQTIEMLSAMAGQERWKSFRDCGDLDFAYEMPDSSRFRCNFLKQANGYGAVFRLIPRQIATLDQLGVPPVVEAFGHLRAGLVLVTGPTGSGKSTTLAALIDHINGNVARHIVTIEEPIEFVHQGKRSIITQREVGADSRSFADALKAALRQDADIVLVGEMRDLETISLALTAAETGLLVLGTLHTNNARKTVDRMVDVFPASQQAQVRMMLASSLRAVIAQLLLKRRDGSGRLPVHEILTANSAVSAIIREGATQKLQDVIVAGKNEGMQLMDDAIFGALQRGLVSPREAFMKAIDKKRFQQFLEEGDVSMR